MCVFVDLGQHQRFGPFSLFAAPARSLRLSAAELARGVLRGRWRVSWLREWLLLLVAHMPKAIRPPCCRWQQQQRQTHDGASDTGGPSAAHAHRSQQGLHKSRRLLWWQLLAIGALGVAGCGGGRESAACSRDGVSLSLFVLLACQTMPRLVAVVSFVLLAVLSLGGPLSSTPVPARCAVQGSARAATVWHVSLTE